jgi:MoxR-like ATPase
VAVAAAAAGQKAPLHNASTNLYDFILRFLQTRIKAQPVAISRVATQLAALLTRRESIYGTDKALLSKLVLCGPTGCGKTETTLALKKLLGMEAGYEYEKQCVEIDGSTMGNETQVNCLTGGAAGLVGYRDGGSLAERLLQALHSHNTTEWTQLQRMNKRSKAYQDAKQLYEQKLSRMTDEERYPPYLMLCIDEVDKVAPEFMLNINGLLETGHYQTPSGISFVLPRCTRLLIVMTSNYGDAEIVAMPWHDTARAIKLVEQDMQQARLSKFTIERMGELVIYYPLAPETLNKILTEKLGNYLQQMSQTMWKQFGNSAEEAPVEFLKCSDTLRGALIKKVLVEIDVERGLRNALRKLYETLETLFTRATGELATLISDRRLTVPLSQSLLFTLCKMSCNALDKQLAHQLPLPAPNLSDEKRLQHHITRRLCEDPLNAERVEICRQLGQKIDVLSLSIKEFPLVSIVLAPDNALQPQELEEAPCG